MASTNPTVQSYELSATDTRTNLAVCWLPPLYWGTCINLAARSWQVEIYLSASCVYTWKSGCLSVMVKLGNQGCLAVTVTHGNSTFCQLMRILVNPTFC